MNTKLQKVRKSMCENGMEALFITDELNQRYLLRYAFTDGMLLILPDKAYMITDFRYFEEAQKKADDAFDVVMPSPRVPFICDVLKKAGVKTVGYESASLSCDDFERLRELYGAFDFVPAHQMLLRVRQVKEPDELVLMQKAQDITDNAFAYILKTLTPTMTEVDVALELEFFMRRHGAETVAFDTIAVSGDASALPHGKPRNIPLRKGFLTMDFGARFEGYCSDMTRTVVLGKADAEMKRLYNTVLSAQLAGLETICNGIEGCMADKVARDIIDMSEFKGGFGHSLGHSVGLFIHESPGLSMSAKGVFLKKGNVVTVEPGIYLQGKYGCRIEDMVAVTENGCNNFTHSPKEIIELF